MLDIFNFVVYNSRQKEVISLLAEKARQIARAYEIRFELACEDGNEPLANFFAVKSRAFEVIARDLDK